MSEEQSFEELLNQSFKTIRNGEVVEGTVIDVKPEQAYVVSQILEAIYTSSKTGKPVIFE